LSKTVDGPSVSESYLDVFDAAFLDLRITHMSLALLDQDLAVDDYKGFAEKLIMRAGHLIDIGAYNKMKLWQRISKQNSLLVRNSLKAMKRLLLLIYTA
jgi:hypothetical protein